MHLPLEYEIVSWPPNADAFGKEKVIYMGGKKDMLPRLNEIVQLDPEYGHNCTIRKISPKERSHENKQRTKKKKSTT